MYECKDCGAMLRFDITLQKMKCDHCNGAYDLEEFDNYGVMSSGYQVNVFSCPQCGGEIYTQDNDMTGRCEYCGTNQVFKSRVEKVQRPEWIVPFSKDKEYCKKIYQEAVKKAIYAPSAIKNQEYIDSIKGVYMPYWIYHNSTHKNLELKGMKAGSTNIKNGMFNADVIKMQTKFDADYYAMMGDASSWYSDEISSNIRPFYLTGSGNELKPFKSAYMCGFCGETADTEAPNKGTIKSLDDEVSSRNRNYVYKQGNNMLALESGMEQAAKGAESRAKLGLLPVWFLSYNKGKRVSYSVINGQTGQLAVEFPADIKKFLLGTFGVAVLLFFLLNLFWIMRPEYIALAAAIGAMWGIRFASRDLRELSRKEAAGASPEKYKNVSRLERIVIEASPIPYVILVLMILAENFGFVDRHPLGMMVLLPIAMTIWTVIRGSIDIWRDIRQSQAVLKYVEARVFPGYWLAYISMIIALVVQIVRPVSDYIYFGVGFLCMAMTLVCLISVIGGYNRMATRKMPQFEHMGGDDHAK